METGWGGDRTRVVVSVDEFWVCRDWNRDEVSKTDRGISVRGTRQGVPLIQRDGWVLSRDTEDLCGLQGPYLLLWTAPYFTLFGRSIRNRVKLVEK